MWPSKDYESAGETGTEIMQGLTFLGGPLETLWGCNVTLKDARKSQSWIAQHLVHFESKSLSFRRFGFISVCSLWCVLLGGYI